LKSPRLAQFVNGAEDGAAADDALRLNEQLADAIVFGAGNAEILMSGVAGRVRFCKKGVLPESKMPSITITYE
jgi:hypothetical protein